VWRRVLKLTVCNGHQHSLHHRIGAWIEPYASSSLPNWRWFWDASTNNLYHDCTSHWELYAGVHPRATRGGYSGYAHYVVIQRPLQGVDLVRTTVEKKNNCIFMTGGYGRRTRLDHVVEGDEEAVDI
jgi:hypothetical protein